jgi:AsmA protein
VTAAYGFKRLAIAVAALVAAAFVTLIGLSFLIPTEAVRDAVKKDIQEVTGLSPTLRGAVSVSLFPHASVSFHDVVFGDGAGPTPPLQAAELKARLRYFPLLAGRIEIADVTLLQPTVNVTLNPDGQSNWSKLVASFAQAVPPSANRGGSFSEIVVHDGSVTVHDAEKHIDERLDNLEVQLAWPAISRSFAANGRFVWNNEPVNLSLTLSDFLAALTGQHSGVKFRLASAPLNVTFDGAATDQPTLKLEGTLGIDSPSLREALQWTGKHKLPFGGFGRFALRAQSNIDASLVSLTNVNVELDGNRAEGVLALATDGHHAVQGTLASDSLDFTPYVSGVRIMAANTTRSWDRLPITLDGLAAFDLDLRLSATSIKIANAQLGRTAVALNMRGGKLNVTIGESQSFGGLVQGSFGLGSADAGVAVSSHVQFVDVDLASCLGQIFGLHKLEGRGTLALDVEGEGASVLALTHTLNGTASVDAHDGALAGINVEELLRRLEKRPLSGNGDFRSGRTPFDRLILNVKIEQGMISVIDLHIDGPSVRLKVAGQASVPRRDLDLRGKATLVSTETANAFELPFAVEGPWDDPLVLPDASSLIRHSDAAAPLLDAVKKHSAGDAVRSVIDQLFAAPPPGAAPAGAQ